MRPMKEKVQVKLNAMASILLDGIIVPGQDEQEGSESLTASYYDKHENKYTFSLDLTVVPKHKEEETSEQGETSASLEDQIALILEKITELEEDVSTLKLYHSDSSQNNETQEPGQNGNEGTDT